MPGYSLFCQGCRSRYSHCKFVQACQVQVFFKDVRLSGAGQCLHGSGFLVGPFRCKTPKVQPNVGTLSPKPAQPPHPPANLTAEVTGIEK